MNYSLRNIFILLFILFGVSAIAQTDKNTLTAYTLSNKVFIDGKTIQDSRYRNISHINIDDVDFFNGVDFTELPAGGFTITTAGAQFSTNTKVVVYCKTSGIDGSYRFPYTEGSPILLANRGIIKLTKGAYNRPLKIVIMGDSHAEGLNYPVQLAPQESLFKILKDKFSNNESRYGYSYPFSTDPIDLNTRGRNIAKFDYFSAQWMADGDNAQVDVNRNITKAISYNSDVILAAFTSNEPSKGVSIAIALSRMVSMFNLAKANGIRMVFTGTYPRTQYSDDQRKELIDLNTQLIAAVGANNVLNVIGTLGNSSGSIKTGYAHDDVHINGAGNEVVANKFIAWMQNQPDINAIAGYEYEVSADGEKGWTLLKVENDYTVTEITGEVGKYYRARRKYNNGSYSPYSNAALMPEPTQSTGGGSVMDVKVRFAEAGSTPEPGYINMLGNPALAGSAISGADPGGSGIVVEQVGIYNGSSATNPPTSSFNNGQPSSGTWEGGTISQNAIAGIWGDFTPSTSNLHGFKFKNVPAGSYKLYLLPSIKAGIGGFDNSNCYTLYTIIGSTTKTVEKDAYENASATPATTISPDANGEIKVMLMSGRNYSFTGLISVAILRSVSGGGTANQSPVVNAGGNKTITAPASTVTLTGTATDADGTIANSVWTKVSGGAATIVSPNNLTTNITGLQVGTYVFRLTATDNQNATSYSEATVTVSNTAPTAITVKVRFAEAGTTTEPGFINMLGNPAAAGSAISGTDPGGSGIVVEQVGIYNGSSATNPPTSSFNNGQPSTGTWEGGALTQNAIAGIWADFFPSTNNLHGFKFKNVPSGNYKLYLLGSIKAGVGPFDNTNSTTSYIITGSSTQTVNQNTYLNTSATTAITVSPDANGEIKIMLMTGNGDTIAALINLAILKSL